MYSGDIVGFLNPKVVLHCKTLATIVIFIGCCFPAKRGAYPKITDFISRPYFNFGIP